MPGYGEQDFTQQTPNSYLMDVCPLSEMEHVVEAVLPSAGEAGLLQIRVDSPCLLLHRRTWSEGHLVSYARLLSPRFSLQAQLQDSARVNVYTARFFKAHRLVGFFVLKL